MLRAALWGAGRWGRILVESVQGRSSAIGFTHAITRDPARHADFAARCGLSLVADEAAVLADPAIDAIVIATPHSQHHAQIVRAAHAGKHVFVEKPVALTREDTVRAIDECAKAGVTLGVGFNRRYAPAYAEVVRRVRSGEVGEVLHIEAHQSAPAGFRLPSGAWRTDRLEAPAGAFTQLGIHLLDGMIHLAGPVKSVFAMSDRRAMRADVDDVTTLMVRLASGVTGYLATSNVTGELKRFHVFGTKGWVEMRGDTEVVSCGLEGAPVTIRLPETDKERAVLERFAQAVAEGAACTIDEDEVVNGIASLEAILASAACGAMVMVH